MNEIAEQGRATLQCDLFYLDCPGKNNCASWPSAKPRELAVVSVFTPPGPYSIETHWLNEVINCKNGNAIKWVDCIRKLSQQEFMRVDEVWIAFSRQNCTWKFFSTRLYESWWQFFHGNLSVASWLHVSCACCYCCSKNPKHSHHQILQHPHHHPQILHHPYQVFHWLDPMSLKKVSMS